MGTDKALLELEGRAFVERIAAAIRPIARSVTLVGRGGQVGDVAAIPDLRPGLGPLAGIESALAACATEQALVVACDLPFVTTALLELLLERSALQPDTAVVPLDADGRVSPLCAVYPRSSLPLVTELLDRGERTRFPTDLVPFADYAHLAGATELLRNVNTPADLTDAERIATGLRVR